jgi:hypothetical protein
MDCWQLRTLDDLRSALPSGSVEPYGSVASPEQIDTWSDLDVVVRADAPFEVAHCLGGTVWAFQDTTDASGRQTVRVVMADGRRIDLTVAGGGALLPPSAPDNPQRFAAALAAARFGRGADLIGLHLVLGVLRDALVQQMVRADQETGSTHHRHATARDAHASASLDLLRSPLRPETALTVFQYWADVRAAVDPEFRPDVTGLAQVVALGTGRPPTAPAQA